MHPIFIHVEAPLSATVTDAVMWCSPDFSQFLHIYRVQYDAMRIIRSRPTRVCLVLESICIV